MRKQILLVGFLIAIATQSLAQGVTVQNANPTSSIANRGSYIADSIFRLGTRDTVKPVWWNPSWSFNGAFQLGLDGNPYYYSGGKWNGFAGGSGGSGTVTSVTQGYGMVLTPSPITTSGSVRVDTAQVSTKANVVSLTSNKVPYTGANANVDLGAYTLNSHDLVVNHASGSGSAATITKGGSGEALTVVKVSGVGNAASITGGITEIETLNLTNDLADSYIASAATWNAKVSTSQLADSTAVLRALIPSSSINYWHYASDTVRNDSTNLLLKNKTLTVKTDTINVINQNATNIQSKSFNVTTTGGIVDVNSDKEELFAAPVITFTGGAGSESVVTVDENGLKIPPLASVPSGGSNGVMYYDIALDKFRAYENGAVVNT